MWYRDNFATKRELQCSLIMKQIVSRSRYLLYQVYKAHREANRQVSYE